jgi:hypothetical protein
MIIDSLWPGIGERPEVLAENPCFPIHTSMRPPDSDWMLCWFE